MTTPVASNSSSFDYTSLNPVAAKASSDSASSTQQQFLTLLTTQLKNQDPLNPMDNAQMTSQLAQISTVQGISQLNTTLQTMMSNATQSQSLQAAGLVGHGVLVPGSGLALQADATGANNSIGGFDLSGAADGVTVTIKDSNGLLMRTLNLGAMPAGSNTFQWDGSTNSGAPAAAGSYSFTVAAAQGQTAVTANALQAGMVTSVMNSSQGVSLNVGKLGTFNMSDVKEIL